MSENPIQVELRKMTKGSIKAFADVTLESSAGTLTILDLRVVSKNGEPPWVAFPTSSYQKNEKTINRPVLDMRPGVKRRITEAVINAFNDGSGSDGN